MLKQDLFDYVREQYGMGVSVEKIRENLISIGWKSDEVDRAIKKLNKTPIQFEKVTLILIGLFLLGIIVYLYRFQLAGPILFERGHAIKIQGYYDYDNLEIDSLRKGLTSESESTSDSSHFFESIKIEKEGYGDNLRVFYSDSNTERKELDMSHGYYPGIGGDAIFIDREYVMFTAEGKDIVPSQSTSLLYVYSISEGWSKVFRPFYCDENGFHGVDARYLAYGNGVLYWRQSAHNSGFGLGGPVQSSSCSGIFKKKFNPATDTPIWSSMAL